MAITKTYSFDETTVRKLLDIVGSGNASETLRNLIQKEWERIFGDGEEQHAPTENPFVSEME